MNDVICAFLKKDTTLPLTDSIIGFTGRSFATLSKFPYMSEGICHERFFPREFLLPLFHGESEAAIDLREDI